MLQGNEDEALQILQSDMSNFSDILPPFASEDNKKMDREIKIQRELLKKLEIQLSDNTNRTTVMMDHMKNIQQEFNHCQGIYEARQRETESEEHLMQLSQRQIGRLALEIKRYEAEIAEMAGQTHASQNHLLKVTADIESARQQMNLDKNELEDWLKIQTEKEEDTLALLKYSKEDDNKIKDVSIQIEKLLQEVYNKKNALTAEVTETQVAQLELDRCTDMFRQLHSERQDLIKKWEDAVHNMQQRDADIELAQKKHMDLEDEAYSKLSVIEEKQKFLDERIDKNHDLEKKIENSDRMVAKYRMEQQGSEASLRSFQDELEIVRNTLTSVGIDLSSKKLDVNHLRQELQEKQKKYTRSEQSKTVAKEKLNHVLDKSVSLEEKSKELQEMLKEEETQIKDLEKEIKNLKQVEFKKSQDLFKSRKEAKDLEADINGAEASVRNWEAKILKLDQEIQKQQELIYTQDFQIQQLERKIRRAQGERTDEEQEVLTQKIEQLQKEFDSVSKKAKMLNHEWKKSLDDQRQAKIRLEKLQGQKKKLTQNLDSLNLYNDSATRQLSSMTKEKEELMVEENILRLELRRLRGFLNARSDEVYSLEARQVQLQLALEERQKEIDIHKDLLRVDIKNTEEERYSAKNELRERLNKVEKIKRKYEILVTRFAPEDGAEEHSQAYYVIKAAQRREELQREGDNLDTSIKKAEKEVRALENTLILMNGRNTKYRNSLRQPDVASKDFKRKEILEQQTKTALEKLGAKRKEMQQLQQDILHLDESLKTQNEAEGRVTRQVEQLETRLNMLMREITEQENKKNRTNGLLQRVVRFLKNETPEEYEKCSRDIHLKELKEISNYILSQLSNLVQAKPELKDVIEYALDQPMGKTATLSSIKATNRARGSSTSSNDRSMRGRSESKSSTSGNVRAHSGASSVVNATFAGVIAESTPSSTASSANPAKRGSSYITTSTVPPLNSSTSKDFEPRSITQNNTLNNVITDQPVAAEKPIKNENDNQTVAINENQIQ